MADSIKENKESLQRQELHRKIWAIADDVRGAVDGWDFKQYILGILFYRFISENITEFFNKAEHEAGDLEFDYAKISDEEAEEDFRPDTVEDKGFFILPSQLFENVVKKARENENLNTDLANIFKDIEGSAIGFQSEDDIKGLFEDVDTTSNKLGGTVAEKNKRLCDILTGIDKINFGDFKNNDIDAFGDAYEYLISNYASNAGKSGGEFFTPQTVSKLLARLVMEGKKNINKVYDPTCGSATTAHAVMELNSEDGGNRKFIMVQLPEETDEKSAAYKAGYKNICEIGKERIRRAGEKILEDNKDKDGIQNLDIGFRVLKVDSTNMKDVYYKPDEYSQGFLDEMVSNIKEDRNDLDLLFACLLEWGLPLTRSYDLEEIHGKKIHNYDRGALVACFEENINEEIVKEIAKKEAEIVVFRDSSFRTSADKINVEEIFKELSPDTSIKIM